MIKFIIPAIAIFLLVLFWEKINETIYKKELKWDRAKHLGEHDINIDRIDLKDSFAGSSHETNIEMYISKIKPLPLVSFVPTAIIELASGVALSVKL